MGTLLAPGHIEGDEGRQLSKDSADAAAALHVFRHGGVRRKKEVKKRNQHRNRDFFQHREQVVIKAAGSRPAGRRFLPHPENVK